MCRRWDSRKRGSLSLQFVRIEITVTAFEFSWLNAALSSFEFKFKAKPWAKIRRKNFFVAKFKVTKNRNTLADLQHQLAAERHHQMDSPPHLYQHQQLQLHPKAFDALSEKETMERWFQDQEWIDSNKHSDSEEDIVARWALRPSWANWMRRLTVDCSSVDWWWWWW